MVKWIGKGVLKVKAGKFLNYGDEIPKDYPKARVAQLKAQGLIGDIVEIAKATPFDTDNSELEASHKELIAAFEVSQNVNQALTDSKAELEAAHNEILGAYQASQKVNESLTAGNLKMSADKDYILAAFGFLEDIISQIVKTEPNREIKKILEALKGGK